VWDAARGALRWTDIEQREIWRFDPLSGECSKQRVADRVGFFAIAADGRLLLGQYKTLILDGVTLADVEPDLRGTRINDGRTDRAGNVVFGTMSEGREHPRIGSFYQYSSAHGLRRLDLDNPGIANSICFSPDGATMWFADSPQRTIWACDYDAASARVSRVRVFVEFAPGTGVPDGSIVDADGCLWNAVWGAGEVRRYTADGRLDRTVRIPTKNPTCPAFGGADLRTLYVTTSRQEHSDAELEAMPQAGGVFSARIPDVRGLPDALFR
jgi:sugar lactone lactonase YvrE